MQKPTRISLSLFHKESINSNFYKRFSKRYIFTLLLRLSPYYIYHFLIIPYRRNVPEIGYKLPERSRKQKKRLIALYDAMLNILLKGYIESMGEKIIPSTGQMLSFLFELTFRLDEYLDKRRKTNDSLSRKEALEDPRIKEQLNTFRNYVRLFGREEPITSYLKDMFATHYDHYAKLISSEVGRESFENTLEISQMDSGQSLSSAMEIVRLFNMHQPNQKMLNQFYLLGTLLKFIEDIIDLACDIQKGHLNLFCSLAKQHPDEMANLYREIENQQRFDFEWLNKNCHGTFVEYLSLMDSYFSQISSQKLKLVCDLSALPIFLGDYDPEHHAAS